MPIIHRDGTNSRLKTHPELLGMRYEIGVGKNYIHRASY